MGDAPLMAKYLLSEKGLHSLFIKLLDCGAINPSDLAYKAPVAPVQPPRVEQYPPAKESAVPHSVKALQAETLELPSVSKKDGLWSMGLGPESLILSPCTGGDPLEIQRTEIDDRAAIIPMWGGQGVLQVKCPKTKLKLKLDASARQRLETWLGPPTEERLRTALRSRFAYCLPIAIVIVLTSLPMPADPLSGLPAVPFGYFGALLGMSLAGLWMLARYRPMKELFLLDVLWFVLLAVRFTWNVVDSMTSPFWLLFLPVLLFSAFTDVLYYTDFRWLERRSTERLGAQ